MVFFIRNINGETIAEVELWNSKGGIDLAVSIDIAGYSKHLLDQPFTTQVKMIESFSRLNELRGWFFESFIPGYKGFTNHEIYDAAIPNIRKGVQDIANDFVLFYTED